MRAVSVEDLKPGMILARTLVNDDMVVILSENTLLTKALSCRKKRHVQSTYPAHSF